jgi:hypothetical protein
MIRLASSPEPHVRATDRSPAVTLPSEPLVPKLAAGGLESGGKVPESRSEPEQLSLPAIPALPEPAPASRPGVEIAVPDWDELFHAVEARLRASVDVSMVSGSIEKPLAGVTGDVQLVVLECLTALRQLHTALTHERYMHQQFEQGIANAHQVARQALAATRALAGIVGVPVASLEAVPQSLNHGFASASASVENDAALINGHAHRR